jgi:uncharacterized iron-regulated protein
MRRLSAISTLLAALLLSGCTKDEAPAPEGRWKSPLYRDHPLVGQIWKPAEGRYATAGEVYAAMKKADFVLIGEKHDNTDHHWLQAKLVSEMAAYGRRPALVFEMLTESQQAPLDAHLANYPDDAAGIGAAVGWEKSGWPDWKMYQPIAQQALYNDMPLLAGGLDRDMTKRIAREGPDALGEGRATALMLDQPIEEDKRAEMRQVIYRSHCQQLPEPMLDPMVSVTLAKDAVMADRMIEARRPLNVDVSVLIAGGGHVRADWGVPLHLKRRAPDTRIVTVGLAEVEKDASDPAAYAERYDGAFPFDFVWFTPRVDDDDPCEAFAEQLKKMREKRQENEESEGN